MKVFFPTLRILALSLAFVLPAVGATTPPTDVTVQFSVLALVEKGVNDLYYSTGGKLVALKAAPFARAAGGTYVGPTDMAFYRMEEKDGKSVPVLASTVKLPAAGGKMLVIMAPSGSSYTIGAVEDTGTTPLGKIRFYNASPLNVSVLLNDRDQKVALKAFEAKTVDSKDGGIAIQLSYQDAKDGQWKSAMNSLYLVANDERLSLFCVAGRIPGNFQAVVNVFAVRDVERPAAPARGATPPPAPATGTPAARRGGGAGG
jgi:hypothetical protein